MISDKEITFWRVAEIVLVAVIVAATIYYVYHLGWWGLAYSVLAALFGGMAVYWFGDIMPIIGPFLRRGNRSDRDGQ